jgi:SAM-dependent methyltransferase
MSFDAKRYWEGRLAEHPGLAGVGSLSFGRGYVTWLYRVRRRIFRRLTEALPIDVRSASVLDVGSGTGFYLERWLEAGVSDVVGSDITSVAVERIRAKLPQLTIEQLDMGAAMRTPVPRRFDIVSMFDVLFHIVDDTAYRNAFANAALLVRPGGYFVFSEQPVPAAQRAELSGAHQRFRSMEDIESLLGAFDIVRVTPMFVVMEFPIAASPVVRRAWRYGITGPSKIPGIGWLVGALLAPLELVLTRIARSTPTTQIFVCRRRGS